MWRAHRLLEAGEHANAAYLYEELAQSAHDRGRLRVAPHLYIQAGRANLLGGQAEAGMRLVRQGLGMLAEAGRWLTLSRLGRRLVIELRDLGRGNDAAEIERWLESSLRGQDLSDSFGDVEAGAEAGAQAVPRRGILPLQCPYCGATVHPDEVEWIDENTAECAYCGSMLREGESD